MDNVINFFHDHRSNEIGRKLVGSEELPDLKIGQTVECFHGAGTSERVIQVLMI